ncbi:hypothetical protein [Longirhabdus pacifica]|uniref:hypothetical protein n=1 Tax=Longirhabdus pacifica TaxID=2305227 RepID=UPI0013E8D9B6|nr:hypothetical protein [Longirhabdus pacifica]
MKLAGYIVVGIVLTYGLFLLGALGLLIAIGSLFGLVYYNFKELKEIKAKLED